MNELSTIRNKYPQYQDMSDIDLADALHSKYYSDIPKNDYYKTLGLGVSEPFLERQDRKGATGVAQDIGEGVYDFYANIPEMTTGLFKGIGQTAAQAKTNPKRLAQNIVGGGLNTASIAANIPRAASKYLESRDIPEVPILDWLSIPDKPSKFDPNENVWERIKGSIHLPRPGEFNYAENLPIAPRGAARFPQEVEADQFIENTIPQAVAASIGGVPGLMLEELGAERNPFMPIAAAPFTKQGRAVTGKTFEKTREYVKKVRSSPADALIEDIPKMIKKQADKLAIDDLNVAEKKATKMIDNLYETNKKAGITKAEIEKTYAKEALEWMDDANREIVSRAFKTKDLRDIQQAEITLGIISRNLGKTLKKGYDPVVETRKYQIDKIKSNMENALVNSFELGQKGGGQKYKQFKTYWNENVRPIKYGSLYQRYRGEIQDRALSPEDFIADIARDKNFRATRGRQNIEILETADLLRDIKEFQKEFPKEIQSKDVAAVASALKKKKRFKNLKNSALKKLSTLIVTGKILTIL